VSFVALRDFEETAKLAKFSTQLQDVENNLPIKAEYRNPKLGEYSPIVAVNVRTLPIKRLITSNTRLIYNFLL
jgi:hypothetical protein